MKNVEYIWIDPKKFAIPFEETLLYDMISKVAEYNEEWLKAHPNMPKLYESGVRLEAIAEETALDIAAVIERGAADIDSLVAWRLAELWAEGIKAKAELVKVPRADGGVTITVRVRLPNGATLEDVPSERHIPRAARGGVAAASERVPVAARAEP